MVTALAMAFPGAARADGAFPDSQSVLLPADHPAEIIVATTFGLISTEDGGATWSLACESNLTVMNNGGMYAMGPSPENRLYAIADVGALASADGGCTWQVGAGLTSLPPPALPLPFDLFPAAGDAGRLYLLAADQDPSNPVYYLYRSTDGGVRYSGPIYTSPAGVVVTGIEAAASSPGTVYMTFYQGSPVRPGLGVSVDGGDTWTTRDIQGGIGSVVPMLAAVDGVDANKVYLRLLTPDGVANPHQGIAITTDAGLTWTTPVLIPNATLTGFTRLSSQTMLVTGSAPSSSNDTVNSFLYRSDDGGQTFVSQALAFHPLGLAQRAGTAFIATKDIIDGFALVSSTDDGRTWMPRLRFRDITSLKACVRATCEASCKRLVDNYPLFSPAVCTTSKAPQGSGCGCVTGVAGPVSVPWLAAGGVVVLGLLAIGQGRRRARRARGPRPGRSRTPHDPSS